MGGFGRIGADRGHLGPHLKNRIRLKTLEVMVGPGGLEPPT